MPLKPLKNDVLGTWLKSTLPHTPEVVGSSPASATIKEPGIDTKSVPGLFFFIGMFFVCFGNILISKKGMQLF